MYLQGNMIGVDGVKYLADGVESNSTLLVIHLGGNNIGDEGAKYLADALKINSNLQEIDLEDNRNWS
jgi:Ran GTPase-activating protein (RanGAP) involved in mRNA processing and transport